MTCELALPPCFNYFQPKVCAVWAGSAGPAPTADGNGCVDSSNSSNGCSNGRSNSNGCSNINGSSSNGSSNADDGRFLGLPTSGLFVYATRNTLVWFTVHDRQFRMQQELRVFATAKESVSALEFARCASRPLLFVGSAGGGALLLDLRERRFLTDQRPPTYEQNGWPDGVACCAWIDDRNLLYAVGDRLVRLNADRRTHQPIDALSADAERKPITCLAVSKQDPFLLGGHDFPL